MSSLNSFQHFAKTMSVGSHQQFEKSANIDENEELDSCVGKESGGILKQEWINSYSNDHLFRNVENYQSPWTKCDSIFGWHCEHYSPSPSCPSLFMFSNMGNNENSGPQKPINSRWDYTEPHNGSFGDQRVRNSDILPKVHNKQKSPVIKFQRKKIKGQKSRKKLKQNKNWNGSKSSVSKNHRYSRSPVWTRLYEQHTQMETSKDEKFIQKQLEQQLSDMKNCTFTPELKRKTHVSQTRNSDASTPLRKSNNVSKSNLSRSNLSRSTKRTKFPKNGKVIDFSFRQLPWVFSIMEVEKRSLFERTATL